LIGNTSDCFLKNRGLLFEKIRGFGSPYHRLNFLLFFEQLSGFKEKILVLSDELFVKTRLCLLFVGVFSLKLQFFWDFDVGFIVNRLKLH
jgi:hypothetical protein